MPNHVTNRLEIIADNETVQKVMNFLKGVNEEDGTPCHIDFNKIIPMPKELLIEASSSGKLGMEYLTAMQRKPLYTQDDLATIQRVEELQEKKQKRGVAAWSVVSEQSGKIRLSHLVRVVYCHLGHKMECL